MQVEVQKVQKTHPILVNVQGFILLICRLPSGTRKSPTNVRQYLHYQSFHLFSFITADFLPFQIVIQIGSSSQLQPASQLSVYVLLTPCPSDYISSSHSQPHLLFKNVCLLVQHHCSLIYPLAVLLLLLGLQEVHRTCLVLQLPCNDCLAL